MQSTDRDAGPLPASPGAVGSSTWNHLKPQNLFSYLERKGLGFFSLGSGSLPLPSFLQATLAQPRFIPTAAPLLSRLAPDSLHGMGRTSRMSHEGDIQP